MSERPGRRTRHIRAFTLLEVLVALGAVALISIGLARIFGATSQTLRAGRRVSHFNDYARTLERIMREDFKRMTRRGFLVIANEETQQKVNRFPGDRFARRRRIDQVMFFTLGNYHTQRTPLYPGRVASGVEAEIWFGHGLRQEPGGTIAVPALDDLNRDGSATDSGETPDRAPFFGEPGPDEFASDWILARHVSVITQPAGTPPPYPTGLSNPPMSAWADNPVQIDLAPAQSSLFRNVARGTPATLPGINQIARGGGAVARPLISSGMVDVINGSLSKFRSIILDAQAIATANPGIEFDPTVDNDTDYYLNSFNQPVAVDYAFQPDLTASGATSCYAMKQWMLQALPAEPRKQTRVAGPAAPTPYPSQSAQYGGRMRCEIAPPDYLGTQANNGNVYIRDNDFRRTDQVMLASSSFAPHCTEFIVEWSFGETYQGGASPDPFLNGTDDPRENQIIWHGLDRYQQTDFDAAGRLDRNDLVVAPYYGKTGPATPTGVPTDAPIDAHIQTVTMTDGRTGLWLVKPRVIQEPVDAQGMPAPQAGEPFYSIFGYVDPTFPGPSPSLTTAPDTIPCAWPRLIRVTMTLAYPADPSFEQTYQFIFQVPDDSQGATGG